MLLSYVINYSSLLLFVLRVGSTWCASFYSHVQCCGFGLAWMAHLSPTDQACNGSCLWGVCKKQTEVDRQRGLHHWTL